MRHIPKMIRAFLYFLRRVKEEAKEIYEKTKKFVTEVGDLREEVESLNQKFRDGEISREVYERQVNEAIKELNELMPSNVSQRLEAIDPNWESKVLGIREEYLPTESNITSANSEPSAEELAQAVIENLDAGDFHFAVITDYITASMTDSELDSFNSELDSLLTERRDSEPTASTETPNDESTSEEIIQQIVEQVSEAISIEEIVRILEGIQTHNLDPTNIINELDSRIEIEARQEPTSESDDSPKVYLDSELIAVDSESIGASNGDPGQTNETDLSETGETGRSDPSSGNNTNHVNLSAEQDERSSSSNENSVTEQESSTSEDLSGTDQGSFNNSTSSSDAPYKEEDTDLEGEMIGDIAGG
ncbi:hypothetical protein F4Y59_11410 [Candidatus Poribacteria bacterium]|nr:hypothetical protein [Candidatus Poribacteria bacterium]MYK20635.1 hypothetical protein [Candidatus Poribacteria bacterium]